MKSVLICCSGGITSKLWAKRLSDVSTAYVFDSVSESYLEEVIQEYDIILFAPQTRVEQQYLNKLKQQFSVQCFRIPDTIYANMIDEELFAFLEQETMQDFIQEEIKHPFLRYVIKLSKKELLKIIMSSMMSISMLMIGVSMFQLLLSIPLGNSYQQFLDETGIRNFLSIPIQVFTNSISIILCVSIGYHYAKFKKQEPVIFMCFAVVAYLLLIPIRLQELESINVLSKVLIDLQFINYSGIFIAIITSLSSSCICMWMMIHLQRKQMPKMQIYAVCSIIIICLFSLIRFCFQLSGLEHAFAAMNQIISIPMRLVSGSIWGFLLFNLLSSSLWLIGIHGPMLLYTLIVPLHATIYYANISAFANGIPAPYPAWFTNPWVNIGGSGATLALNILMIYKAKSKTLQTLGKMSMMTSLFNINEPLIFGLPIVFNPVLAIPFISVPIVNLLVTWFCMDVLSIVPLPTGAEINTYFLVGLNAFFTNQSISGLLLFILLLGIDLLLYYPFFRRYDEQLQVQNQ